jgi:RNA polymerase sigma factor (TIGR02999 family)
VNLGDGFYCLTADAMGADLGDPALPATTALSSAELSAAIHRIPALKVGSRSVADDAPRPGQHIDELVPVVYEELRRLARAHMRKERIEHTLQTTALANEAYLRLSNERPEGWTSRAQFLGIAARSIRQILIHHARGRSAAKRGGGLARLPLEEARLALGGLSPDLLDLDEALAELAGLDARKAQIVEMRFFAGMTNPEIAEALGLGLTTVEDDWYAARAWLGRRLR